MKRHLLMSLFLVIILGLLAACTPQTAAPADEPNTATAPATGNEVETPAPEPATPTTEATEAPVATATSEATAAEGLCLDVPRPALALFIPGEEYLITNPLSGESCYTTLDGEVPGNFQAASDGVYYTVLEGDQFVIKRVTWDGSASLLPFTAVSQEDALLYHSFAVSADGGRIAWGSASAGADYAGPQVSNMPPQGWLDAAHVVVAYSGGGDNWGTAVVGLDGSIEVLQSEPNASFVEMLR